MRSAPSSTACEIGVLLTIEHQLIAPATHTADERAQADREDLLPLELAPHSA
jgi:hypothetical protein